jgi:hypothetical protein
LAAAFAEAGQFPDAVETAEHTARLAAGKSNADLASRVRSELNLYRAGEPYPLAKPSSP